MRRVYSENSACSARKNPKDRKKEELDAIEKMVKLASIGGIALETSRHTHREMERAPTEHVDNLKEGITNWAIAQEDHKVIGFDTSSDQYGGYVTVPLVTDIVDEGLYEELKNVGLQEDDAKHFMYAAFNGYDEFVTLDEKDFIINRKEKLEGICPSMKIWRPSELISEISSKQ